MFLFRNDSSVKFFSESGQGSDEVIGLPTYAMQRLNPYPFGIDPVSKYSLLK